jgi:hypothetical protein
MNVRPIRLQKGFARRSNAAGNGELLTRMVYHCANALFCPSEHRLSAETDETNIAILAHL